jgi:hypothetical protein
VSASAAAQHDQPPDASLLPSQLLTVEVLRRPVESAVHASVRFDAGGYSCGHIQGEPAALRELAAALLEAADRADSPAVAAPVAEGVAG